MMPQRPPPADSPLVYSNVLHGYLFHRVSKVVNEAKPPGQVQLTSEGSSAPP